MIIYPHNALWSVDGHVIHLKFIESISYKLPSTSNEDSTIDILKGHTKLIARTCSGKEHEILLEDILERECKNTQTTSEEMANAIFSKWIKVNS